jgi:hypothetical protein
VKPRISKRVRDEAALICAVCASGDLFTWDAATLLGLPKTPERLGDSAFRVVFYALRGRAKFDGPSTYAEAEALLRCGWSPGDEV